MGPTLSLIQEPDKYAPTNAEMWYVVNTQQLSDSELQDFKYVFKSYTLNRITGATVTPLGTYKVPSRPSTGNGLFTPHRLLKSEMGNYYTFSFTQSGVQTITDDRALLTYRTTYGWEYNPSLTFSQTNNNQYSILGVTYSLLGLSMSTSPFNVGDNIFIDKVNKQINQYYDGPAVVIATSSTNGLITNISFGTTQSSEQGQITSISRITSTSSTRYAYNGTRQYDEIGYNFGNKFTISKTYSQFLTNYTDYKEIFTNQYETVGFMFNYADLGKDLSLVYKTYDVNNTLLNTATSSNLGLTSSYIRYEYGIGTANLSTGFSFSPPTEGYYTVTLFATASAQTAVVKRKVVNNCSIYDNVRIMFLNRVGSFDFWNFAMDSKRTTTISRVEFWKSLDYNYSVGDRGNTVLFVDANDTYTINSNWISEYDFAYLNELVTSPEVYIINETTLKRYPIVITDDSYVYKTQLREMLFNLELNFKLAYKTNLQIN